MIGGNHEHWLANTRTDTAAAHAYRSKYGSALDIAHETLSEEKIDELAALPSRLDAEIAGLGFTLCHGAPDDRDRYVYPTAGDAELAACEVAGHIVLMGHTHYPMVSLRRDCTLLNPGSVGAGARSWRLCRPGC